MTRPHLTVDRIKRVVALHYGIGLEKLENGGKAPERAGPRQVAMYLSRRLISHPRKNLDQRLPISFPQLGRRFERDQSTVNHAYLSVQRRIDADPAFAAEIATIIDELFCLGEVAA
jgi:chromosomal replication initiator protein